MKNIGQKLKVTALIAILTFATLPMMACGEKTKATLDRVGSVVKIVVRGYNDQVAALKGQNLPADKVATAERLGRGLTLTTDRLIAYLDGIKEVDETNIAEVTQKIGAAVNEFNLILQNPDVKGIDVNSKFAQILNWASTGLTTASFTLAALFPKPVQPSGEVSFSAVGGGSGKKMAKAEISFEIPNPPPAVQELLKAANYK